ncbi:MAG: thioredoxin fold domain-containing protein [Desulfuromonadaceae bacterium]
MREYLKNIRVISISALIGLPLVACSAAPVVVRTGDKAEINFTCRLQNGELAATTCPDASVTGETKAPLYMTRHGAEDSVAVTAGPPSPNARKMDWQPFEQEIIARLAPKITGLKVGEPVQWVIAADRYPVSAPNERQVKMALVRKRDKEMRLSIEEYTNKTGKDPEVGQLFVIDKLVPGKIAEVSDKEVLIRFAPADAKDLVTPFGPVTVRELADSYELVIAAEIGHLLRTGPMVGRISAVDGVSMTIDYGHPFAGEKLNCDVKVVAVTHQERKESAVATPAEPPQAPVEAAAPPVDPQISAQTEEALRTMNADKQAEFALSAAPGDLATVNYTAMLEDGSVFYSTRKAVLDDAATKKAPWFSAPKEYFAEIVPVGKAALFPGVGEALAGMTVGGTKRVVLLPEQAFGPSDPQKLQKLPLVRTMPRTVTLPADEYVKRFDGFPVVGKEIKATPYFSAKVVAIREREVDLQLMAENGAIHNEPFGTTVIRVDGATITTTLKPVIGAIFPGQSGYGVITVSDADSFTVDMNNPLAGKTVTIDLELTALTAAAALPTGDLPWLEEHDAALVRAKKEGKPAVLVLHAEWCSFCKKLFSETMPDPRVSALRDKFTWIKVNSDKLTDYKKIYGQEGYPMIVLFKADGSIAQKLDGYQEAAQLRAVLQEVM